MVNVIMFGPPGSGKGTQSKLLQERFNLIHLSTGDVCREEIKFATPEGLEAKRLIDGGNFFPDKLAYRIVEKFLDQNSKARGIVYDGIPRHIGQTEHFDEMLASRQGKVNLVIELKVDEEILIQRLLKRGESSGRLDDSGREVIVKRLRIYDDVTAPIADYYKKQDLYFTINGIGSLSEVFERIAVLVEKVCLNEELNIV
ncbi:adenylate kinase [Ancylomarina sp. 16SWW S1-10-2]|uniref:adenylate kinase n=1 Tax=Ancylomarina sp. 16SWW S1-10-2 TaxID=2499681 RepID=UPI0012AD500D|nr:adenylate kinase [Ancylomarina sp. 16SWW S1-10-2]MRT91586.1 adenylate kinase [Ancylomarina sp. 16SWW S1-10-2]